MVGVSIGWSAIKSLSKSSSASARSGRRDADGRYDDEDDEEDDAPDRRRSASSSSRASAGASGRRGGGSSKRGGSGGRGPGGMDELVVPAEVVELDRDLVEQSRCGPGSWIFGSRI